MHHGVEGYTQEEEFVALEVEQEVDDVVSSKMETWINENSRLSDMVS